MSGIHYHGRRFRMVGTSTGDAEAVAGTLFDYQQDGDLITCTYQGGSVRVGRMIGLVADDGTLTVRFTHIYTDGRMASGEGISQPEVLLDGRLRLHETYTFLDSGVRGTSTVEEIG